MNAIQSDNEHISNIHKEANAFAGKNNDKVRALAFSSIPYIGKKLNEELQFVSEARSLLSKRSEVCALTLACGDMKGEYLFFKKVGATSIDAFDISEGQKERCYRLVYDNEIPLNYVIEDVNAVLLPEKYYDVVYMQQSLHHLVDVEKVLNNINNSLKENGIFVLNDYVGEPFLQRGPKQREVCQRIWSCLPDRLRTTSAGEVLDRIHIPNKSMLSPFEAVRSDAILPALSNTFRVHKQLLYGGIVFPIMNNFAQCYHLGEVLDDMIVKLLWEFDKILVANGTVEPSFVRGIYCKKES